MAVARARTISIREFQGTEVFSGEMRVTPGSKTRKGVHRQHRQASCKSLVGLAGTDAGCEAAAGESAHTSAARAASRDTDAETTVRRLR